MKNTITIPDGIYERLKRRVDSTDEFSSVEGYVNYILRQVVEKLEGKEEGYSAEDEEKVKERLRSLGYLE